MAGFSRARTQSKGQTYQSGPGKTQHLSIAEMAILGKFLRFQPELPAGETHSFRGFSRISSPTITPAANDFTIAAINQAHAIASGIGEWI